MWIQHTVICSKLGALEIVVPLDLISFELFDIFKGIIYIPSFRKSVLYMISTYSDHSVRDHSLHNKIL